MEVMDRATNAALGAGATEGVFTDVLAFAPFDGFFEIGVVGGAGIAFDVLIGGRAVVSNVRARTGTAFPTVPGELDIVNHKVRGGTRIIVRVRNPTAGALAFFAYARISDVPRQA